VNAAGYLVLRPKPVVSPFQLPSAPGQTVVAGTLNAFTVNYDPIKAAVSRAPSYGSLRIDPNSGIYTYTPDPSLAAAGGTDNFAVTVTEAGFHPIARLLGLRPTTSTATVSVAVSPQATPSNGYYIANTTPTPVRVEGYAVNQASLSPTAGYQIQSVTTTTDIDQTQTLLQIDDGKSVTAYLNPTGIRHDGIVASYSVSIPSQSAISPDGARLYVSGEDGGAYVTVIDTASAATAAKIALGGSRAVGLALTPDGSRLYAAVQTDSPTSFLAMIDTASNSVAAKIPVPSGNSVPNVVLGPDGLHAYIRQGIGSVQVVDTNPASPAYNTVTTSIPTHIGRWGMAVSPDGKHLYVGTDAGVDVVDTAAGAVAAVIPTYGEQVSGVAVSPDGKFVYANLLTQDLDTTPYSVAVVDTTLNTVVGNVALPSGENHGVPFGIAVSPDGKAVYVSEGACAYKKCGSLDVIDANPASPTYRSVVDYVATPGSSWGVRAVPNGAYVAAHDADSVVKIVHSTDGGGDGGRYRYAVSINGGSAPQCSASGGLQCQVAGSTVYLMERPGSTYGIGANNAQSQSDVLQTAVKDDLSNAVFSTKSSPVIGYTNPLKAQGFSPYINNTTSPSTNEYTTQTTTTTATSYTWAVSTAVNASAKIGDLGASATVTATETWGTTVTDAQTYTQKTNQTVQPGETLYLYTETPVYRFYGDWRVQYGNTTYNLADVWYDTPYSPTSSYPAYLGAYTCPTGSQQCSQVAAGDLSSYPSAWPSAVTLPVAESNQSNYNTAYYGAPAVALGVRRFPEQNLKGTPESSPIVYVG